MIDDETLISLVAGGDLDQLGILYMRHSAMIKRALRRTAPDMPSDEVEDLTQDVFILLADKASRYVSRMRAAAYLYGIAVKKALAWRRRTWLRRKLLARERQDLSVTATPSPLPYDQLVLKEAVRQALSRLPEKQRTVLLLHSVEGFDSEEIASILNISAETVRTRIFRARQAMPTHLGMELGVGVVRKEAS